MSSFTGEQEGQQPFISNIPPINSNPNNTQPDVLNNTQPDVLNNTQPHVLTNTQPHVLTNTDSRLDRIEQRLDTIEQLLTQQAQLPHISFASQGPLNFSDLVAETNASFQNRSASTTMEMESNESGASLDASLGTPVGGKNKTKSNKKKKSKNQTKRKRKV